MMTTAKQRGSSALMPWDHKMGWLQSPVVPQSRGGTLPNVARIELGKQLPAFQGSVFCHRRHLLSDYKPSERLFHSNEKSVYFFYVECEFKAELQSDCSPSLQRNKLFCVSTAWLCADFYMRHCQNSHTTSTAAAAAVHSSTKSWGKGKWAHREFAQVFAQNTSDQKDRAAPRAALPSLSTLAPVRTQSWALQPPSANLLWAFWGSQ